MALHVLRKVTSSTYESTRGVVKCKLRLDKLKSGRTSLAGERAGRKKRIQKGIPVARGYQAKAVPTMPSA